MATCLTENTGEFTPKTPESSRIPPLEIASKTTQTHSSTMPTGSCRDSPVRERNKIMAGNGPPPSGRQPKGKKEIKRETVKSDGKMGGFPLPKSVLGKVREPVIDEVTGVESFPDVEWHPMTVKWWEAWRRSPQSVKMVTEVDWYYLLETALMHHSMWTTKRFELAAEVRMRVSKFGATPEDRARLRIDIEIPGANSVGVPHGADANVVDIKASRRAKMIQAETERKAADDAAKIARLEAEASS
jgi:hypothetical protein